MKVSELITLLQTCNADTDVVVHGYEGGYRDITEANSFTVARNVHSEWYYGPHEKISDYNEAEYHGVPRKQVVEIT